MDMKLSTDRKFKRMLVNILSIFVILAMAFPATGGASAQKSEFVSALDAANITVDTTDDELNTDGDCSLREAIQAANTDTAVDACPAGVGADVIDLPAGIYYLSIVGPNEDANLSGDLDIISDLTINGVGSNTTQIDGANLDRVFHIIDGNVNISAVTVQHGFVMGTLEGGGGIMNHAKLVLTDSVVTANIAAANIGGGIFNYEVATAILSNTTVSENTAGFMGGGIYNVGSFTFRSGTVIGNTASYGSGFGNEGNLELSASTITDNTDSSAGGGILNSGGFLSLHAGTARLTNVTISGNNATFGAGIRNLGNIEIYSSTISSNTGPYGAGFYSDNAIQMKNSILADNTLDCVGILASMGYNLVEDTSLCTITGDTSSLITGLDPMLASLQDNGGPTQTHALLSGSPAIDAGNPDGCTGPDGSLLETDQRGEVRTADGNGDGNAVCDIGAYEAGEGSPSPNPWLIAFPENDAVEGWEWPEGATVTLTINNAPGLEWSGTAEVTSWGDPRTYLRLEFGNDYNLQVGDVVTLTDATTVVTHVVQNLSVSLVNTMTDTVTGTADPGAVIQAWPHGFDQTATVEVIAGDNSEWQANFAGVGFDLLEGIGGRSQIVVQGNATAVDWDAHQTYDIYAYNPLTGTIQQITYLANTDEYDPSWSPNGKKIAHDVVYWDGSHGIFVTDLRTGVSTPLTGADDGGNDAAWSPNGKWIAFDRRWYGEPNIYIVPDVGGVPDLVRSDAITVNWAPNSKRVVFQQLSDGSVWTAPVDGGKGGATFIAPNGSEPAWSPDGNWIAYVSNGNIWKIPVNIHGKVLGDPIQVTSLSAWNVGGPTWSLDNQTIFFNGGVGDDLDIWKVAAGGGEIVWLVGAPESGDYGPENARNSSSIAYASNSPDGQAARLWVAAYTYDPPVGTFNEGTHPYHFDFEWSVPEPGSWSGQEGEFVISDDAELRDGYVLLRGPRELYGIKYPEGFACEETGDINSSQPTRFLIGWVPDFGESPYSDARAHFESITANAVWDDSSAELVRHEIIPYREDDWFNYVCTFTEAPLKMDLRVNYGHDWVESFYEAGHAVTITLTGSDGLTVKATAELVTEPKDYWGGEPGFQTMDTTWFDAGGNPMEYPPDIQAYDWVYAQVDNGATAKVQIGEINGTINLETDSIEGAINASWITEPVQVECLDWGSGQEPPFGNKDGGFVSTDGVDPYSCSWHEEWDIQYYQNVGVSYFGPDGHWVANAFYVRNPHFTVFPEWEWFDGNEWPDGATVTITVAGKPECTATKESWGYFFNGSFGEGCDVVVGDIITFTDGTTTRTHTVQNLAITDVDKAANTVAGTAENGAMVFAWVHGFGETEMQLTVEDGNWLADFGSIPFDLVEGTCGRSEIRDEAGNSTAVDWCVPNPRFGVRANVDQIEGWEWAEGETVTLTIDDPGTGDGIDYTATQTVGLAPWDPNQTYVFFNLWNVYNIQPGDIVGLSNGTLTKTTTVTNLAFTDIDVDNDVVTGVAAPNSHVDTWACDNVTCINRHVDADDGGAWTADFGNPGDEGDEQNTFNIVLGTWIDSSQTDEDGDQTYWGQNVPNPYIEAAPYSDWVHAREWPLGTLMTLEIDDPSNGLGNVDYSATATMQQAPWNPNDPNDIVADFRWPDQFAPGPGYVLTMSGNGQSKTLTISQLNVTGFDLEADTVSGTGTPNAKIQVCANVPNRCITRGVIASEGSGNWTVDYGVPGTGNDDPDTFDVQPGSNGWAAEYEADSDRTWFDWHVPNPRFSAFPEWEYIEGWEWPHGATVHLAIDDPATVDNPDFEQDQPVVVTPWDPNSEWVTFNFAGLYNMKVGDVVTLDDGTTTRTHTVLNLAITEVNADTNTVSGKSDVNAVVNVWPHATGEQVMVTADGEGNWQVDFSGMFDLVPGECGRAEIRDRADYLWTSATAVDWCIPNPRIVASITEDWFYVNDFAPNTELDFGVYASLGGTSLWEGNTTTDGSGHVWVDAEGRWNLEPGNYLVVSDGNTTKELVIEGFTFDIFNLTNGQLSGTAPEPYGRRVWVGIGWENDGWSMDVTTDGSGAWLADFGTPVPSNYSWVAAQIFDPDGDASELRPAQIINE